MGHLQRLDFVMIAAYASGMLLIGWWSSRRQKSTEEYFVAGRGIGSFVVGISMIATLLSSISYLATPGEMIQYGPGYLWGLAAAPISFLVVGYLVIPRIMRHKITSGYELLHERFGMNIRQTASVLFILVRVLWMGFIVFTCSGAVAAITGIDLWLVLILVGVFATIYTVMGGIRAVMMTDVVQFVILFGGALLAVAYVTYLCEGFSWWPDLSSPQLATLTWDKVKIWSFNPFDRITVVSMLVNGSAWWICTSTSDQTVIQRYLCTRNAKQARRSLLICLVGDTAIGLALGLVGIALLGFFLAFPDRLLDTSASVAAQADKLFPHFIGAILPQGVSGLLVAALFAAAMSSLDSAISSIGSVLMTDFKASFARGCGDDQARLVRRAKWIGLCIGLAGIALSYTNFLVPGNLVEKASRISNFFVVPMFVLFALAFFVKFSTPKGAWTSIIVGFLAGVFFSYYHQIVNAFKWLVGDVSETGDFSFVLIMPLSVVVSLLAGIVVSLFTKQRVSPASEIRV